MYLKIHWPVSKVTILFLLLLVLMAMLSACIQDSGSSTSGEYNRGGWVSILSPPQESVVESCDSLFPLSGNAFISPTWWKCCTRSAEDTGVTVIWENKSTGSSGSTKQYAESCYPYPCAHTWNALVPLALGENIIQVTATDPSGRAGSDRVVVYLQSVGYSVAGRLINTNNDFLPQLPEGMTLLFQDEGGGSVYYPDTEGNYRVPCLTPGTYTLIPRSSGMAYQFEPPSRTIVIANRHILDADFTTGVYLLNGRVYDDIFTNIDNHVLELSGNNGYSRKRVSSGQYYFYVPSGSYIIKPCFESCYNPPLSYTYSPASRSVTVTNRNVYGIDFSASINE